MIRRPPRSTRTHTLSLHDALPIFAFSHRRSSPVGLRAHPASPMPPPSARTFPPCPRRSEEHTSELQSLMRISYAVFCLKKKKTNTNNKNKKYRTKQQNYSNNTT